MADPVSFAIMVVAQVGIGYLFPSEGPRLKDLKISASTYGAAIPEVFGTARVPGNMIWSDKIREHKRKKMQGKGGFYNEYTYTCTYAMGLCKGPITRIMKMWANGKIIYDVTEKSEVAQDKKYRFRFYSGGETQTPDQAMVELLGEDNSPAFRGLAYVMFDDMPLEDFGNQIPQITVEVFRNGDAAAVAVGPNLVGLPGEDQDGIDSYQTDTMLVDPASGYAYFISISDDLPFGEGNYIRRVRMEDGKEDFRTNGGPDAPGIPNVSMLLGVSPSTGYIIGQEGIANNVPWYQLEPTGFTEVVRYGVIGAFGGDEIPDVSTGRMAFSTATIPGGLGYEEYGICMSGFGEWMVIRTAQNLVPVLEDFQRLGDSRPGANYGLTVFAGVDTERDPLFYAWEGADASAGYVPDLRLYKLEADGVSTIGSDNTIHRTWSSTLIYSRPNPVAESGGLDIGFNVDNIFYDEADGNLVLAWTEDNVEQIGKYDLTTNEFSWIMPLVNQGFPGRLQTARINGRLIWTNTGSKIYIIDTITGQWVTSFNDIYYEFEDPMEVPADQLLPPSTAFTGIPVDTTVDSRGASWVHTFYDSSRDAMFGTGDGGRLGRRVRPIYEAALTNLQAVVESILREGGLGVNHYDMSRLAVQPVRGFGWASGTDIKSILDQLRMIYLFDIVESNGKLIGIMRDIASNEDSPGKAVRKVQQKVLGSSAAEEMDYWPETRLQDADLPSRVMLTYMNWDNDFMNATAVAKRMVEPTPTMFSRQQLALEINVVFTGSEAKNQVNKMLWSQWGERVKHATRLPWSYIDLDPADVVTVQLEDGRNYEERLHQMEFGADLALAIETFSRDAGAYLSDAVGDAGSSAGSDPITTARKAVPFILNTPLLRDKDDSGGSYSLYYSGLGNTTPTGWKGASLFKSRSGLEYDILYGTDNEVEWGAVAGIVPDARHGHFALDWETRIRIFPGPEWFDLEPITDDELWNGLNLCVIGDEVLQFRDAVQNSDGTWTIWNLLRGRRGTEYATGAHKVGERFVFLSSDTIQAEGELLDARGQGRYFKAVGQGYNLEQTVAQKVIYEPRDLMPYAPKDIRREISTGDQITVTWRRRTRKGGNLVDFTGNVPLHETTEKYEFYILSEAFDGDLSRGNTVPLDHIVFQAETTTSEITFNVSEMTAPFAVNLDTLHVLVYQISATVGRGFPGVRSIEPWRVF